MTDGKLKLTIAATEYDLVVEGTSITYVQRIDIRKGEDYERCKEVAKEIVHGVNIYDKLKVALNSLCPNSLKMALRDIRNYSNSYEIESADLETAIMHISCELERMEAAKAVLEESTHG